MGKLTKDPNILEIFKTGAARDRRSSGLYEFTNTILSGVLLEYSIEHQVPLYFKDSVMVWNSKESASEFLAKALPSFDTDPHVCTWDGTHQAYKLYVTHYAMILINTYNDDENDVEIPYVSKTNKTRNPSNSNSEFEIYVYTFSETEFTRICNLLHEHASPPSENMKGKVFAITVAHNSITVHEIGIAGVKYEPLNYTKNIREDIDHLFKELGATNPFGRFSILRGLPGTGKTYLIRSLIDAIDALFILIPSNMVSELTQPALITSLIETKSDYNRKPIVLILEDADACLLTRGADNHSAISTILNFTSGIVGDMIDIRVLATTNAKIDEVDPALLRSGRLTTIIDFPELTEEESTTLYRKLTDNPEAEHPGTNLLADIYKVSSGYSLDSKELIKRKKTGF